MRWIGLAVMILLLSSFAWVEVSHRINYGHFVLYGIHIDVVSQRDDFGIPGIENAYAVEAFNCTVLPVALQGCQIPKDISPFEEVVYRYQVQRFDAESNDWVKVMGVDPTDCEPLVMTRIWPGQTIRTVDWEATGARDGLQKGDAARFVVFMTFNKMDDAAGQRILASPSFNI